MERLKAQGNRVNLKRAAALMRRKGLETIYPRKRRDFSNPGQKR